MSDSQQTLKDIERLLKQRLTEYNARLILQSVCYGAGINSSDNETPLTHEQIRALCMGLIRKGGPAFQVGRDLASYLQ